MWLNALDQPNPFNSLWDGPCFETNIYIYILQSSLVDVVSFFTLVSWRYAFAKFSFSTPPMFNADSRRLTRSVTHYICMDCVFPSNKLALPGFCCWWLSYIRYDTIRCEHQTDIRFGRHFVNRNRQSQNWNPRSGRSRRLIPLSHHNPPNIVILNRHTKLYRREEKCKWQKDLPNVWTKYTESELFETQFKLTLFDNTHREYLAPCLWVRVCAQYLYRVKLCHTKHIRR